MNNKNLEPLKAPTIVIEDDFAKIYSTSLPENECGTIENVDTDPNKTKYLYRLPQKLYEELIILDLEYCLMRNPAYVTLWFKGRSKIIDAHGAQITSTGAAPNEAAQRVVKLASIKKWKTVRLYGSIAFIEAAMKYALACGMDVSPLDDEQRELWIQIQATDAAMSVEQIETSSTIIGTPLTLAAIGKRFSQRGSSITPKRKPGFGV